MRQNKKFWFCSLLENRFYEVQIISITLSRTRTAKEVLEFYEKMFASWLTAEECAMN